MGSLLVNHIAKEEGFKKFKEKIRGQTEEGSLFDSLMETDSLAGSLNDPEPKE